MAKVASFFKRRLGGRIAGAWLLVRFIPMTVFAYAALVRLVVAERLWRVPPRRRPKVGQMDSA